MVKKSARVAQEWPPANQTKERSVHELFAGAFRNKSSMWIVLVFLRKNTRIHKNGRNSWTFRFGPFFGLVCRGDSWVAASNRRVQLLGGSGTLRSNVVAFGVSSNQLSGALPTAMSHLGYFTHLEWSYVVIDLSNNGLSGSSLSREKVYTPPPHPFCPEGIFQGRGVGVYILRPPAAGILYAPPPLLYTPHP